MSQQKKDSPALGAVPAKDEKTKKTLDDEEFEEFRVQEWTEKKADAADEDNANVWEDNWEDETLDDEFAKQLKYFLREELIKTGHISQATN
ncbi:hypothetical protein WR25_04105 [Diploscapter pachys]|uniref:26S proteasome complex subunit dss-1 n=1 Tax=Diploscapter pachys TaxID=2018661 RepID=A0A2A2J283_9BILA|nr:hypothetical protein WR25_04105 [Diploscapter pachys]